MALRAGLTCSARAIDEYRKGGRKNPIMKGFAATLKDEDIAARFAAKVNAER